MSYLIYRVGDNGKKLYLVDLPNDENPLGGIGYRSMHDGSVPKEAGTCPTEEAAQKLCAWIRTASFGPPTDHFYEQELEAAHAHPPRAVPNGSRSISHPGL